jgi:hypothetical protein
MNIENYLDNLSNGDNLESLENFDETTAHFLKMGHRMSEAKRMAAQTLGSAKGGSVMGKGADKYGAAAQFDIKVTRNSGNINRTLPVALFGAIDLEGAYAAVLTSLPSGVSCSVANVGGNLVFTYTEGAAVDTITVTCNQIAYASFVKATITDVMSIRAIRYSIADTTQLTNFDNLFQVVKRSLFGADKRDNITVSSYRSPNQQQNNIIDIGDVRATSGEVTRVDKETSIVIGLNDLGGSGAYSINLSMFVAEYNKLNASSRL